MSDLSGDESRVSDDADAEVQNWQKPFKDIFGRRLQK